MKSHQDIGIIRKIQIRRKIKKIITHTGTYPKAHFAFNPPLLYLDVLNGQDYQNPINKDLFLHLLNQLCNHLELPVMNVVFTNEQGITKTSDKSPIEIKELDGCMVITTQTCHIDDVVLCTLFCSDDFIALLCRELSRYYLLKKHSWVVDDATAELCAAILGIGTEASVSNMSIMSWDLDKKRVCSVPLNVLSRQEICFARSLYNN